MPELEKIPAEHRNLPQEAQREIAHFLEHGELDSHFVPTGKDQGLLLTRQNGEVAIEPVQALLVAEIPHPDPKATKPQPALIGTDYLWSFLWVPGKTYFERITDLPSERVKEILDYAGVPLPRNIEDSKLENLIWKLEEYGFEEELWVIAYWLEGRKPGGSENKLWGLLPEGKDPSEVRDALLTYLAFPEKIGPLRAAVVL